MHITVTVNVEEAAAMGSFDTIKQDIIERLDASESLPGFDVSVVLKATPEEVFSILSGQLPEPVPDHCRHTSINVIYQLMGDGYFKDDPYSRGSSFDHMKPDALGSDIFFKKNPAFFRLVSLLNGMHIARTYRHG